MKIVHVIDSLGIGGTEILLRDTLRLLDVDEHIVCYSQKPDTLFSQLENSKIYYLNHQSKWAFIKTVFALRKIIKYEKPDIVHAHLYRSTMISRLACYKLNVKLVSTIHNQLGIVLFDRSKMDLWLEKLTASLQHHLIGVSQVVLDEYKRYIPFKGKTYVLHNFVRKNFFNQPHESDKINFKTLQIIAVGNLKAQKNYQYLLHALREIKTLPITVDIYGEGAKRKDLQAEIERYQLPVRLKGAISNVEEALPHYHCFITCSSYEGYGIAPMEAMATGIPVLASDIPVYREVLGDNALYFDLSNTKSLAQLINKIIKKEIDLLQLSERVKKHAQSTVSSDRYLASLKKIYSDISD